MSKKHAFDLHSDFSGYIRFFSEGNLSEDRWRELVEAQSEFLYSDVAYKFGRRSVPDVAPTTLDQLESKLIELVKQAESQAERVSHVCGLKEKIADVHFLPLNWAAPSLTGCFTSYQKRPLSIVAIEGFFLDPQRFAVICAHEMAHAVHMHFQHPGPIERQTGTLGSCLWNEGVAEYVSYASNLEVMKSQIMRGSLTKYTENQTQRLASDFLEIIDVPLNEESAALHSLWFGSGDLEEGGYIPPGAAYFLGYKVIEKLNSTVPLLEIVRKNSDAARLSLNELAVAR